jgi:hypothetical protein
MIETDQFQLGDAVEHRGVEIAPRFPRRDPEARYVTRDEALPQGFRVREVSESGAVPELLAENPLAEDVLLYDGEELVGAKQNRILNVTVLVAAASTLPIPVSCVEQGRWSTRSASFAAAPHASHPDLRRRKAQVLGAQPLARGAAQADVWEAVAEKAARLGVSSPTGANADSFRAHSASLASLEAAFPLQPGQCGAVLSLAGRRGDRELCLDAVSRPDAFALLWPKLRAGYLLDALERLDEPVKDDRIAVFVDGVGAAAVGRQESAGRGADLRLHGDGLIGSGLELDGELLQLSAFSSGHERPRALGRIARPSRRSAD